MIDRRMAALALSAIALGAPGCGKSSKPLTRAQLIAKADAICRRVNERLKATKIESKRDIERVVPRVAAFEQQALADLGKLIPPASMANDWKTIVAGAQALADDTAKLGEYAKAKKLNAAHGFLSTAEKTQDQVLTTAKRDGFKDCSHRG